LCEKKKKKYHCTENQNLNLNTERHRQTSLWIGFLIIRLFGNLKVIILFTGVISPDYLIPNVISDYLSLAFREKLMITVAKHVIILVSIRSLATPYAGPHKLFKSFLKLPRWEKTIEGGNFLWRMKLKKLFSGFAISHALWTIFF
jgi:hypothetical protein